MSRTKIDLFKDAFTRNSKLGERRAERVTAARKSLKEAAELKGRLPVGHHAIPLLDREHQAVTLAVTTAETNPNPGKGLAAMKLLEVRAADLHTTARGAVTENDTAVTHVNRKVKEIREQLAAARKSRRDVLDDPEAAALGLRIDAVTEELNGHAAKALSDPTGTLGILDGVLIRALQLATDAQNATALPPTPGGKRAASRGAVTAVTGVPELHGKLDGPETDRRGRTGTEQVAAVLDIFDDHFAVDETAGPAAKQQNGAMRLTAIVNTLARKLAAEQNDLRLTPLLAKSLMKEYGGDLTAKLTEGDPTNDGLKTDTAAALKLASALVIDDPVGKLLSGNMTGPAAVQTIRDMAEAGGVAPSAMMAMLKQQFEMNLASLSVDEIAAGTLKFDSSGDKTHGFEIKDLYGEMSKDRYVGGGKVWKETEEGMVETDQVLHEGGAPTLPSKLQGDRPSWTDGGDGLKFKPKALDLLEKLALEVGAWDGATPDAPTPRPEPEDIEEWRTYADELPIPGELPVTPEGLKEAAQKLKSPTESAAERLKKRTTGLTAAAAALTLLDPNSALDTAAQSLVTKSDREFFIARSAGFAVPPTPDELAALAGALKERAVEVRIEDAEPFIMPAGLRQDHKVRDVLTDKDTDTRGDKYDAVDWETITKEDYEKLRAEQVRAAEESLRNGVMTGKQYEHLRTLRTLDREDREEFADGTGKGQSLEEYVYAGVAARYETDEGGAKGLVAGAMEFLKRVPLTLTFAGDRLFSDTTKDEPKYGPVYSTEVVIARDRRSVKDMIGRGDNVSVTDDRGKTVGPEAGVTGGKDTGWVEDRGENYLRWRSEKDEREGRLDQLPIEDQQIFAAANPNFEELKGGSGGTSHGTNYYGSFHFLLKDAVRTRCAFVVRGQGAVSPVQRTDMLLLLADMLRGGEGQKAYLDSILLKAGKEGMVRGTGLDWEVHLYGGFDLRTDVAGIYIPNEVEPGAKGRIERFAQKFGITCEAVGAMPDGLEVLSKADPKKMALGS